MNCLIALGDSLVPGLSCRKSVRARMSGPSLVAVENLSDDELVGGGQLSTIDGLSDAEPVPAAATAAPSPGLQIVAAELDAPSTSKRKRGCQLPVKDLDLGLRQQLFRLASSNCPCTRGARFRFQPRTSCYQPFLRQLDDLVRLRMQLARLDKQDADTEVSASRCLLPDFFQPTSTFLEFLTSGNLSSNQSFPATLL